MKAEKETGALGTSATDHKHMERVYSQLNVDQLMCIYVCVYIYISVN